MGIRIRSLHFFHSKILRIHAKLPDAVGAVQANTDKSPRCFYIMERGPNSYLLGHVTNLIFCFYVKVFLPSIFNSVGLEAICLAFY